MSDCEQSQMERSLEREPNNTIEEKARQLITSFTDTSRGTKYYNDKFCNGIRGALLCVEEVIKANNLLVRYEVNEDFFIKKSLDYWNKIKIELKKY